MAAVDRDLERIASDPQTRRCSELNAKGHPCRAWAMHGMEVCYRHSMSDEEWHTVAIRGGRKRQSKARERASLRDSGRNRRYMPDATFGRVVAVIGDLLNTTIPGSSEPNYEARAFGALLAASLFRLRPEQKTEVLELLRQVRPSVTADPYVYKLLDLETTRAKLLQAWEEGRIATDDLPAGVLLNA
jgi:hypothetical protein